MMVVVYLPIKLMMHMILQNFVFQLFENARILFCKMTSLHFFTIFVYIIKMILLFLPFLTKSLKEVNKRLKIGITHRAKTCKKFIEDDDMVYANVVARVEGNNEPIFSTYTDNKPLYFRSSDNHFIEGFNAGIRGACEGETRRITIPPEMAYKGEGIDGLFEPHSTWIVDVEVLEIIRSKVY